MVNKNYCIPLLVIKYKSKLIGSFQSQENLVISLVPIYIVRRYHLILRSSTKLYKKKCIVLKKYSVYSRGG